MQIVNPNHKFNGKFTLRRKTERIIFHHSATNGDVSAATVHGWHLNNGWLGIGYHYLIRSSGLIEIGRPENVIGSHSGSAGNSNGIGICVAGNFMNGKPTNEQVMASIELVRDIHTRYGAIPIIGHRDVMATACPGIHFPLDEIRQAVANNSLPYPSVNIRVAGQTIQSILVKGQTMAPIRQVLDILRVPFSWDASTNSAVIGPYKLPAVIINGTGYLPIRELAAAIDRGVGWDANTRTATII
jgi:N-acetylmuramoyl-L-alanine amidase